MPYADPNLIIINREQRQRQKSLNYSDVKDSISRRGQINAIVVRNTDAGLELVAGERRLLSCKDLGIQVEYKLWENLSALEAQVIELEENLRREDLHWHDSVRAMSKLHRLYSEMNSEWGVAKSAENLGIEREYLDMVLRVSKGLDAGLLEAATGINHASGILARLADRRAESVINAISAAGANIFGGGNGADSRSEAGTPTEITISDLEGGSSPPTISPENRAASAGPVLNASFIDWAGTYAGPKFNLIHCDFPYGVYFAGNPNREAGTRFGSTHASVIDNVDLYENTPDLYFALLDTLVEHFDRFASYSAHLVFWFSMNYYDDTKRRLARAGLVVQNHPLIWLKTDGRGMAPAQNIYPKRIYDTALLASRGNRPLTRQGSNGYPAPTPSNPIHPSQKSEPMLRFFLSMLVDETTTVFDPTCGSASALIAAEELGARSILGLEKDPNYATLANGAIQKARTMRALSKAAGNTIPGTISAAELEV